MNKSKLCILVLILALIPSIWILLHLQSNFEQCARLEERLYEDTNLAEKLSPLIKKQYEIRQSLKGADSSYINKNLETFIPLSHEIETLRDRSHKGFLPEEEILRRRLEHLSSGQNNLTFVEGTIQHNRGIKSTIENQTKPVEMSSNDVVEFLQRIEGTTSEISRKPHLQILECRLERKKQTQGNPQNQSSGEVYLFSSKLLKQECPE